MKIFTNEQLRTLEQYTLQHSDLTTLDLIERAGREIAAQIHSMYPDPAREIRVFAGWGNNGADALAATICLADMGYAPKVTLFNIGGHRLTPECQALRDRLRSEHPECELYEVVGPFSMPEIKPSSVVIDGLFGSGLDRPLPSSVQMLIRNINDSGAEIVAIDVPSGMMGEWNSQTLSRNIIHATATLAIESPRLAFFIDDNAPAVGRWKLLRVGMSKEAVRTAPYTYYLITASDIRRILNPRQPFSSKADYGHALICAGSYGMMGAAIMAARGCLRAGAGKVTCYAPKCGYTIMQTAVPEAMFTRDVHDVAISNITLTRDYQAVAIGPGIGTADITINALENLLKVANANSRPLVLDADALNCISLRPIMLNYIPVLSVLTPHAGEFDRIFGAQPSAEARLRKAIEVAAFYNIIIVLKGRYTAIVRPDGKVHINSSGTPALASPGTGDVLTGVITGFIAQGYTPETAAIMGVYLHGLAGQICAKEHGEYGVTATDVANAIGVAIKRTMESGDGNA